MKHIYKNWWVHNLIAHPLMQLVRCFNSDLAFKLHDGTLPPSGAEKVKQNKAKINE